MRAALRAYEGWAPDLKRRTLQRMRHDVTRALKVWGERTTPEEITTQHFVALRQALIGCASVSTIEGTIATVWTLLRFLHDIGELDSVPSKGRVMRKPSPRIVIPTVAEFGRLYSNVHVARWPRLVHNRDDWWRAWLATAYFTALRLGDMISFRWEWIDERGRIVIEAEKTHKRHVIPVHPTLARHLSFLPRIHDRVFVAARSSLKQLRRELKRMAKAAGLPYVSPRTMRQLSSNVWETARPGCGLLIQGSGFRGSAKHYLDPQLQLGEAVGSLEVPSAMAEEINGKQLRLFG